MLLIVTDHRKDQNGALKIAELQKSRILKLLRSKNFHKLNKVDKRASSARIELYEIKKSDFSKRNGNKSHH